VARTPAAGWRRCPIPLLYPDGETHLQSIHRIPEEEAYKYPTEPMWLSESPARRQKEMGYETLGAWRGYWWDVVTSERDPACLFFLTLQDDLRGKGRGEVLYCTVAQTKVASSLCMASMAMDTRCRTGGYRRTETAGVDRRTETDSWSGQQQQDRDSWSLQ
jgi:hypothetical protein